MIVDISSRTLNKSNEKSHHNHSKYLNLSVNQSRVSENPTEVKNMKFSVLNSSKAHSTSRTPKFIVKKNKN